VRAEQRERQIVAGAINFFAERGFSGQTRELARELGITQPLLYRYFPSKQALIERVHEELFVRRWDSAWEALLANRALPLGERLETFYQAFCEKIFSREWVRMFVYAGLGHLPYNAQVLENVERQALRRIAVELRAHLDAPAVAANRITDLELEHAWQLHGAAFYWHVRRHVYGLPARGTLAEAIALMVDNYIAGGPAVLRRALDSAR
jgi:AcrR family transcriptional regulator